MYTPDVSDLSDVDRYWAGYARADGCIPWDGSSVLFSQAIREPVLEFARYCGLPDERARSHDAVSQSTGRRYTYHVVSASHMVKPYVTLGVKADEAQTDLYDSVDFWRGMVDGDGHVTLYPNGVGLTLGFCGTLYDVGMFCKFVTDQVGRRGVKPSKHGSIWRAHVGGDYGKDLVQLMYVDRFSANVVKQNKALLAANLKRTGIRKW